MRRWGTRFVELAYKLGRTEAAVRRKWQRLQAGKDAATWSLERLARRAGYDRSVVKRISHALGVRWSSNGRSGRGARYWVSPLDAAEVLRAVSGGPRSWSRHGMSCRDCGNSTSPHYARGLCRRCYRREQRM